MRALLIVDVQNDFCEGGSLEVVGGQSVAHAISEFLATPRGYDHIVATMDFHIDPGDHFSDNPDFSASWPRHCVVGSHGADFHPGFDHSRSRPSSPRAGTRRRTAASRAPTNRGRLCGLAPPARRRRRRHRRHRHRLLRGRHRDRRDRRRIHHPRPAGFDRRCGTGDHREGGRADACRRSGGRLTGTAGLRGRVYGFAVQFGARRSMNARTPSLASSSRIRSR